MNTMSLRHSGGVLWIEKGRISQGMNIGWVVTTFITSQNNEPIYYLCWYIFQDLSNPADG